MDPKAVGSYARSGISVLIVGTGFAGLTAALECTRKGHDVQILERNEDADHAGMQCLDTRDYDVNNRNRCRRHVF